jgi:hypothetical protein
MSVYARISGGVVVEIIQPVLQSNGTPWPIAECYTSEFVATLVDVTSITPQPAQWWTTTDGGQTFAEPAAS